MQPSTLHGLLGYLRQLTDPARTRDLSDADLLERFRDRREEAAFTLLVQRHGPMVYGAAIKPVKGDRQIFPGFFRDGWGIGWLERRPAGFAVDLAV